MVETHTDGAARPVFHFEMLRDDFLLLHRAALRARSSYRCDYRTRGDGPDPAVGAAVKLTEPVESCFPVSEPAGPIVTSENQSACRHYATHPDGEETSATREVITARRPGELVCLVPQVE